LEQKDLMISRRAKFGNLPLSLRYNSLWVLLSDQQCIGAGTAQFLAEEKQPAKYSMGEKFKTT
jgi:hypothetical protein